ncbi:unnamed protein product [Meganyctiphanes norvegica]|uniref:Uncharacterized protein n=1 Tax=Meganyctiphanes norvegica TaxID=48144 RepID=A0AAV2QIX1_MEGNR
MVARRRPCRPKNPMVSIKLNKLTSWDSFPRSSSVYPNMKVHAVDDLVVDWDIIYAQFRESLKSGPITVGYPSKPKPAPSFKSISEMLSGSSEVFMPPAISPVFWDFEFYPTTGMYIIA